MDDLVDVVIATCVLFVIAAAFIVGGVCGESSIQREAIEKGVAEMVLVDKHGQTEFRWKGRE